MKVWTIVEHDTGDNITYIDGKVSVIITAGEPGKRYMLFFQDGKLHDETAPAVIGPNGQIEYWLDGVQVSADEWEKRTGRGFAKTFI